MMADRAKFCTIMFTIGFIEGLAIYIVAFIKERKRSTRMLIEQWERLEERATELAEYYNSLNEQKEGES